MLLGKVLQAGILPASLQIVENHLKISETLSEAQVLSFSLVEGESLGTGCGINRLLYDSILGGST